MSEMEALSMVEEEKALEFLTAGFSPDDVVSMILKGRDYDLAVAMWRDVQGILAKAQQAKKEAMLSRTVWEIIKANEEKKNG